MLPLLFIFTSVKQILLNMKPANKGKERMKHLGKRIIK